MHGVGLSLGSAERPDPAHLGHLKTLCRRLEPALVSEHLAWSRCAGSYLPDLLPVPRTPEALACLCRNIDAVQDALGRTIALENPSHYLVIPMHEMSELEFLLEVTRRTGCGLLLDVNNVYVTANNLGIDATAFIDAVPAALVHEIHLAGHSQDDALGARLLIDSHDQPISPAVWALYERLIARIGPTPTLIERDGNVPDFHTLMTERHRAAAVLDAARSVLQSMRTRA